MNKCQSVWKKETENKLHELSQILTANVHSQVSVEKTKPDSPDVELDTPD